jgi:hypothetical protein
MSGRGASSARVRTALCRHYVKKREMIASGGVGNVTKFVLQFLFQSRSGCRVADVRRRLGMLR